jgi:hypothetical protein
MLKYSQKKINVSELKNLQSKRVFLRADLMYLLISKTIWLFQTIPVFAEHCQQSNI